MVYDEVQIGQGYFWRRSAVSDGIVVAGWT